jgi:hypothetical protein
VEALKVTSLRRFLPLKFQNGKTLPFFVGGSAGDQPVMLDWKSKNKHAC